MRRLFYLFWAVLCLAFLASCRGEGPKPASHYAVWGIDVSRHQASIDWDEMFSRERPDFVFLKATEGTLITDPMYAVRRKKLADSGVLWGAYHFFGHRTPGKEQAQNFIKTAGLSKGNLIPVLDIENHRFFNDPDHLVREVSSFCNEIKKEYGVYPIIYASSRFYASYLEKDFPANRYRLWIADYSNIPDRNWCFWQHTDRHPICGTSAHVDRNVFYADREKLKDLVLK